MRHRNDETVTNNTFSYEWAFSRILLQLNKKWYMYNISAKSYNWKLDIIWYDQCYKYVLALFFISIDIKSARKNLGYQLHSMKASLEFDCLSCPLYEMTCVLIWNGVMNNNNKNTLFNLVNCYNEVFILPFPADDSTTRYKTTRTPHSINLINYCSPFIILFCKGRKLCQHIFCFHLFLQKILLGRKRQNITVANLNWTMLGKLRKS